MKNILINVEAYEKRVAVVEKNRLLEFRIERPDQPRMAGTVYKGIIESVVPGIGALFVNIGTGKNGFLYIDRVEEGSLKDFVGEDLSLGRKEKGGNEFRKHLKKGQEIIVQVVKEPIGTKGPLLTTDISLPGKYLVLMPFNDTVGVSKRIEGREERARIRQALGGLHVPKGIGVIARTGSAHVNQRILKSEFRYLLNLWSRIHHRARKEKAPSLIYEEYDLPLRMIRDYLSGDIEKIMVDSREEYKNIVRFANSIHPELKRKIFYYRNKTPIYEKFGVEPKIEKIFQRKVYLKSGGSIVIEQTEGLVAIDVNTGKFTGKRNPEETSFKTNMEAACEIARQIVLRDVGGIIIIDFIDMDERSHRARVHDALEAALAEDKARKNILKISSIGIVEMTRQRVRQTVESVSFRECPYCNGKGRVKTPYTVAVENMRHLKRLLAEKRSREFFVIAHPDVAGCLESSFSDDIRLLGRRFRKKITVKSDNRLHLEEVYFE